MLLAIDVGNTHLVLGIIEGERILHHWRIATDREKTEDELGLILLELLHSVDIAPKRIRRVVIGSVVPALTEALTLTTEKYFSAEILTVHAGIRTGLPLLFDNPGEVGADRIANSLAAYRRYGGPVIVVDFGTATTFDYINGRGEYEGGVIIPGIGISMDALFRHAAKLSKVDYQRPPRVIGKNTVHSLQSGFYYGFSAQVDGVLRRMKEEIGGEKVGVVATGGYGRLVEEESEEIQIVDPALTLYGLWMIANENEKR